MNKYPILLPLILLSLSVRTIAQSQKGDIILNPQIIVSQWAFRSDSYSSFQHYDIGSSFHYYFSNKLAAGLYVDATYSNYTAKQANTFSRWDYLISISPELHYSFLSSRFSPFLRVRFGEFGYIHQYTDNPAYPIRQRSIGNFLFNLPTIYGLYLGLGCLYSLKNNLAITAQLTSLPLQNGIWENSTVGLGCQFKIH
ncbi:hypothetical protein [Spirosoma aerolatum]|uniref:hypothetical protein n=1 Tax=Spirosoma aerolatum TaxID=1211326 RepID=UPI0012D36F0F|nr:hypothetical protein [Spirosoma aerolatum]